MQKSRTIFIGDIHGCFDELKLLLKRLDIQQNDNVFFVGDLINKGPKSYKVIKLLYKNQENFKCVKGNSEVDFLEWLEGKPHKEEKNVKKLKEKIIEKKADHLIEYLKELPLYIEKKDFIVLHGGLIPNKSISEHTKKQITRLRNYKGNPWYEQYNGDKKIIYGHWAVEGLQIKEKTIGLDSGCVYGKALTAYILETGEIIQQTALKIYVNPYKKGSILSNIKKIFKL